MSGVAMGLAHGDPCFSSCGVIALDPYIKRKGVNPVALDYVVFSAHTTLGSWTAHLPFLSSSSLFLIALKILPLVR
jgi:pyridoxal/pyridoxine/pyridoxamine kinase